MGNKFYTLQINHHLEKDVCAVASWDSSIHDSVHLNKVTDGMTNKKKIRTIIAFDFQHAPQSYLYSIHFVIVMFFFLFF